ncbi:hypothetical protein [Microbacterium sp. P04]|uniref:hypothetical protein n=1 Tax=Microbacterium sp. P04 TaxID=3366947 RepID=UPI0037455C5C
MAKPWGPGRWFGVGCGALIAVVLLTVAVRGSTDPGELAATAPAEATETPATSAPPSLGTVEARASVAGMLAATLDATVSAAVDPRGRLVDPQTRPLARACEGGTRFTVALDFRTSDNAGSVQNILAVWDVAGYSAGRGPQEDVRYSETLPIERMSLRDTSPVDGLLHLRIVGRCAPWG